MTDKPKLEDVLFVQPELEQILLLSFGDRRPQSKNVTYTYNLNTKQTTKISNKIGQFLGPQQFLCSEFRKVMNYENREQFYIIEDGREKESMLYHTHSEFVRPAPNAKRVLIGQKMHPNHADLGIYHLNNKGQGITRSHFKETGFWIDNGTVLFMQRTNNTYNGKVFLHKQETKNLDITCQFIQPLNDQEFLGVHDYGELIIHGFDGSKKYPNLPLENEQYPNLSYLTSPDGSAVAILPSPKANRRSIRIHNFKTSETNPVPGNPPMEYEYQCAWSPDSEFLAYYNVQKHCITIVDKYNNMQERISLEDLYKNGATKPAYFQWREE